MKTLIDQIIPLVQQAGKTVLQYWRKDLSIHKKEDNSPVTQADLDAHHILIAGLRKITPNIPILSEEDAHIDLQTRAQWQRWWLIDPLDGTKEFIDGREDFTVNIALIEQGKVLFGIVGVPVTNTLYYGGAGFGAWLQTLEGTQPIHTRLVPKILTLVASHRHNSKQQQSFIAQLEKMTSLTLTSIGSSLKFCLLANGQADCYPRFAPTCQWDTAAAQGVLEGAGGHVMTIEGAPLDYTMQESFLNPFFIAITDHCIWQNYLKEVIKKLPNH